MSQKFSPSNLTEVSDAIELVIEEIESSLNDLSKYVAQTFTEMDMSEAESVFKKKFEMENIRNSLLSIKKQWQRMWNGGVKRKKRHGKLPKGLRTPQEEFVIPLLEALMELGGRAEASKVIELVGEKMKDKLNEYDHKPLKSTGQPRWKNTVQWCRYDLIQQGYLNPNSPHGIWEITEEGRRYLNENTTSDKH